MPRKREGREEGEGEEEKEEEEEEIIGRKRVRNGNREKIGENGE